MNSNFPAIIIGGPPHSGKSVLVYSLTRALRARGVPHYVLRACPDGEGDWVNEADQATVKTIRIKGDFTSEFTAKVAGYLQRRHLPLLVDVGGRPTPIQQAVFAHATHAVLLVAENRENPQAYAQTLADWQEIMAQQRVPVIAQIKSVLAGENHLVTAAPVLSGVLANLERGQTAAGPLFTALVDKIQALFQTNAEDVAAFHLSQAPVELALDLPALAGTLGSADGYWRPQQLPALWDYLPQGKPLAGYGRAPNWVYAALAMIAHPAPVWLFDVRLGWIDPPVLPLHLPAKADRQTGWEVSVRDDDAFTLLEMKTQSQYLDIDDVQRLPLTAVPQGKGLLLSGKIPHWLVMAVARQVGAALPWTAVYQPPLGGAVVVSSAVESRPVGQVIPLDRS